MEKCKSPISPSKAAVNATTSPSKKEIKQVEEEDVDDEEDDEDAEEDGEGSDDEGSEDEDDDDGDQPKKKRRTTSDDDDDESDPEVKLNEDDFIGIDSTNIIPRTRRRAAVEAMAKPLQEIAAKGTTGAANDNEDEESDEAEF